MDLFRIEKLPSRVKVADIVTSRYADNVRPADWDARRSGIDLVKTSDNKFVKLLSDGGQSPPQAGWVIMLTGGDYELGYTWTLYGLEQQAPATH